jgi:hypothetical protein
MLREINASAISARSSSFLSLLSGWVQQGVESFFATQRILVDLAIRQNASVMKSLRQGLSDPEHSPVAILTELAVEGTANFIEAQRILLDLAQKENDILLTGVKERMGSNATMAMTDLLRRSIDTFVDMQQDFLTIASKQSQQMMHAARDGKVAVDGRRMVEFARESMDNFVHAQKKFLDVIAEETENATSEKPAGKKMARTEATKIAREAMDVFIDSQKRLLDLAGQQIHVNLRAANKTSDLLSSFRLPLGAMTGEGVKTFVDAEKAMIDNMIKTRPTAKAAAPKPIRKARQAPKPRRASKTPAAQAAAS